MYSFESRVRYSEVDEDQELSLTGMMNYLQDCSTFQSEDLGLGVEYLKHNHRAWWLSSWQIEISRYPRLGERITVSTWPYDFRGIYGYRNFTICDCFGEELVRADSIWFFYDTAKGCPIRAQAEDIRSYEIGAEKRLDMGEMTRHIRLPGEYEEKTPVMISRHHIDTNHHVNNAQYIEIARELLPEGIKIRKLRAEYRKAAVLGDVMIPRVTRQEDSWTTALCSEDGSLYAAVWLKEGHFGADRQERGDI